MDDVNMENSESNISDENDLTESISDELPKSVVDMSTEETVISDTNQTAENPGEGTSVEEDTESIKVLDEQEASSSSAPKKKKESLPRYRPLKLPLSRIKQIMKMDPDLNLAGSEAVFMVAKATELFIEALSKDACNMTVSSKKKTIQKKDVEAAIQNTDALCFLEGIEL